MKNLTWQNPEQLFVAQELINKVKSKCCGIKDKEAVTRKSVRMLLSNEKKRIEQFKEQGLISQEEAEQMVNELGERHNKVFTSYQFLK